MGDDARSNNSTQDVLEWLVKKLFWFLFVPVLTVLSYYTQIRPFLLDNHGEYITGFVDGALLSFSILILSIWLMMRLHKESSTKNPWVSLQQNLSYVWHRISKYGFQNCWLIVQRYISGFIPFNNKSCHSWIWKRHDLVHSKSVWHNTISFHNWFLNSIYFEKKASLIFIEV